MKLTIDRSRGKVLVTLPAGHHLHTAIRELEGRIWDKVRQEWVLPIGPKTAEILDCPDAAGLANTPEELLVAVPPTLGERELMTHQIAFLNRALPYNHVLLWDEPGAGKTIQAIAYCKGYHTVVVCPRIAMSQWVDEIIKCQVARSIFVAGTARVSSALENGPGTTDWFVTSYERVDKVPLAFFVDKPCALVVDECTYIKNPKTKRSKNVQAMSVHCDRIIALSGTPIVNRPIDLWAIMLLLRQRTSKQFWHWAQKYTDAYQTGWGWDFSGASHLNELREDLEGFALRRTREEFAPYLPPKTYETVHVDNQEVDQSKVILAVREGTQLDWGEGFGSLQELRRQASQAKIPDLNAWLDDYFAGGGGPVVVFGNFVKPLHDLAELRDDVAVITGDTPDAERTEILAEFQSGSHRHLGGCAASVKRVLAMTYAVGAMALNLQWAQTIIHLDPPWTPKDIEQAEARAHRIGVKHSVHVVTMRGNLPIEDIMWNALDQKRDIVLAITENITEEGGALWVSI